jgi:multidrug efflux pump subunit AcrA (membrane-fusion protein)
MLVVVVLPRTDRVLTASAQDDAPGTLNLADVVMTDLRQEEEFSGKLESIGGMGTLIPAVEIDLAFETPGVVAELPVEVGQEVQAGDVLARVDVTILAAQDEIAVAQAQLDVANEIAQLEANGAAAEAAYQAALGQAAATDTNIEVSGISVAQAERDLADAQAAYQQAWDPGRDWELYVYGDALEVEREAATAALQYAQENLQIAQANYDAAVANSGSSGLANAQSQLVSAREALSTALSGLADHADERHSSDQGTPTVVTPTTQAQLSLQQAQLNQEAHLSGATITAPMDGTIIGINGHLSGQAGTGPFITMADLSQPTLETFLDETNLDKVGVGSEVDVVFSALPAEVFTGTVVHVDPQLSASGNGLSTLRALVALDGHQGHTLPPNLTADVNVAGLSNRIVRVFLPLDDEGLLAVGDPVTIELPDTSQVPGTVVFVPPTPSVSASGQATFHVLAELADEGELVEAAVATLADLPDETSVDVIFVSDAVTDVMAVPVTSLVALLEGGYAVEKRTGPGQVQLVAVEVGFFGSNNMIAVTSDNLQPGDQVVVP